MSYDSAIMRRGMKRIGRDGTNSSAKNKRTVMGEYSDFLFARPSFLEGVARILDLGTTLNEYNKSIDADATALTMDMYAVGDDLREAIAHVRCSNNRAYILPELLPKKAPHAYPQRPSHDH